MAWDGSHDHHGDSDWLGLGDVPILRTMGMRSTPPRPHILKEGKFWKRKRWCGFQKKGELMQGEQNQQVYFAWQTQTIARLGAQPLSDDRNRGREEEREA